MIVPTDKLVRHVKILASIIDVSVLSVFLDLNNCTYPYVFS